MGTKPDRPATSPVRTLVLSLKATGLWFGFVAMAALVSGLRAGLLVSAFGEHRAHQVASVLTALLIFVAIAVFVRASALAPREALSIGCFWFGLSVLAEFVLLHYLLGVSWARLFADYDLRRGRLFALVPVTELIGPWVAVRWLGPRGR